MANVNVPRDKTQMKKFTVNFASVTIILVTKETVSFVLEKVKTNNSQNTLMPYRKIYFFTGRCDCKKCDCDAGYSGEACECEENQEKCIAPGSGKVCSGHGECVCGQCECIKDDKRYSGTHCEDCTTCPAQRYVYVAQTLYRTCSLNCNLNFF